MDYKTVNFDLKYVVNLIDNQELNLFPEFQRMQIWSVKKQQLFIDSIIRGWPIPGIYLIENGDSLEVLDGQQRLTAIYNFLANRFRVDGNIEPLSKELRNIDGCYFEMLEPSLQRKILSTPLIVSIINEFELKNAPEFFNRFNSPSPLRKTEKINAFDGITKSQVKMISEIVENKLGGFLSFSNLRGTIDDIVIKVAYYFDTKNINVKLTTDVLTDLYRKEFIISDKTIDKMIDTIDFIKYYLEEQIIKRKLSKADFFSLYMLVTNYDYDRDSKKQHQNLMIKIINFMNQRFYEREDEELYYLFKKNAVQGTITPKSIQIRQFILFNIGMQRLPMSQDFIEISRDYNFAEVFHNEL